MDYENLYKDAVSKIKSIIADKKKQGLTNWHTKISIADETN